MHANIQAICSGTFVIQTSHMACNDKEERKKKKNQTRKKSKLWFVSDFAAGEYMC